MYKNKTSEGIAFLNKQSRKFRKLDKAIKNYIRDLCIYLEVDFDKILNETAKANTNVAFDYSPLEDLLPIKNDNYSPTPESSSVLSGVVTKLEQAIYKLYKYATYIIERTELIDNNIKPYIISLFSYPFVFFVYNTDNEIFKWNSIASIPPEKFNLRETLNIKSTSHENYFLESLLILLKEFQKIISKEKDIIENYIIEMYITNFNFYKNNIQTMVKITNEYIPIFEPTSESIEEKIQRFNTLVDEAYKPKTVNIPQLQEGYNIIINFKYKTIDTILFQFNLVSERINDYPIYSPYLIFEKSQPNFDHVLNNLGIFAFKEKIFSACNKIESNIITLLYNLRFLCCVRNKNLYIEIKDKIYLLNDVIFYYIKKDYPELINSHTLNNSIKKAYNCIYNEINNEIDKPTDIMEDNFEKKYIEKYHRIIKGILQRDLSCNYTPSSDVVMLISFMTNNDYHILDNLIKIIKSIFSKKKHNRLGYLFCNCPEKIFIIYKLFFSKLNKDNIAEIESTSKLNNDKTIIWLLNNQLRDIKPIFVNKVTNMNKNTKRKSLHNFLSGKESKIELNGNLTDNGLEYGTFVYKNDIPILVHAKNDIEIKRITNDFNEYIYKLDFKNIDISFEDFEKYKKIIENLQPLDINLLIYNILSLDLSSKEDITNEPLITNDELIKDFIDSACEKDNESFCPTDTLFKAFQCYSFNEHNKYINDNYKGAFSKKFKGIANIEKKDTNKAKGYKGIKISLNKEQLDLINSKPSDKMKNTSKYMKILDEITDFNKTKFL